MAHVGHGRTRMIVCLLIRSVGLKAATASPRVATLPMFVRPARPSAIQSDWYASNNLDSTEKRAKPERPQFGRSGC